VKARFKYREAMQFCVGLAEMGATVRNAAMVGLSPLAVSRGSRPSLVAGTLLTLLLTAPGRAGEVSGTFGALGLGTRLNGVDGGSCLTGHCAVSGGTAAGGNLFHRFDHFDTRGGITGVSIDNGSQRSVVVGVLDPQGSFLDKAIRFDSPARLLFLSPGGMWLGAGVSFTNVPQLTLSTASSAAIGAGRFDVFGTTAAQAAALSGEPLPGRAGLQRDPAALAANGITGEGDLVVGGGLITVESALLLDAQGGHVLIQGGALQAPGGTMELAGQAVTVSPGAKLDVAAPQASGAPASAADGGNLRIAAQGTATVSGDLTAAGGGTNGRGGRIEISGSQVSLRSAHAEASGPGGGGTVLLGGDERGANLAIPNAQHTTVDAASTVRADALVNGDGGKVVVYGTESTTAAGQLSAQGGSAGGNGGFVETSGGKLNVSYSPDTRSPFGTGGTWLINPDGDISIGYDSSKAPTLFDPLLIVKSINQGSDVVVQAKGTIYLDAPIDVSISPGHAKALELSAGKDIYINSSVASTQGVLDLRLVNYVLVDESLAGKVHLGSANINLNGGALTVVTGTYAARALMQFDFEGLRNGDLVADPSAVVPGLKGQIGTSNNGVETFDSPYGKVLLTRFAGSTNYPELSISSGSQIAFDALEFIHLHNHNEGFPTYPSYTVDVQFSSGAGYKSLGSFVAGPSGDQGSTMAGPGILAPGSYQIRWIPIMNQNPSASDTNTEYFGLDNIRILQGRSIVDPMLGSAEVVSGKNLELHSTNFKTGSLRIQSGSLSILNGSSVVANSLQGTDAAIVGVGKVSLDKGNHTWSGGSWSGSGTTELLDGATLSVQGTVQANRPVTLDPGAILALDGNLQGTASLTNRGLIAINPSGSLTAASLTNQAGGSITIADNPIPAITELSLGQLNLQGGTLSAGAGTLTATSALNQQGGSFTGAGDLLLNPGSHSWNGGGWSHTGSTRLLDGAALNVSGTPSLEGGLVLDPGSSLISGTTLDLYSRGDMKIAGNIAAGESLKLKSDSGLSLASGLVVASGTTLDLYSRGDMMIAGNIAAGESLKLKSDSGLSLASGLVVASGTTLDLYSRGDMMIAGNIAAGSSLLLRSDRGLILTPGAMIQANGSGDALLLASGSQPFQNEAGPDVLSVSGGGRWLVYSTDPAVTLRGDLPISFKQYNKTYGDQAAVSGSGNGFLYQFAPQITVDLQDVYKVYDGTAIAVLTPSNIRANGVIDGDLARIEISDPNYVTAGQSPMIGAAPKDVGTGKRVVGTARILSIQSSEEQGSVPVYGYQLDPLAASPDTASITKKQLTVDSIAAGRSSYGEALQPGAVSLSGVESGDAVSAGSKVIGKTYSGSGNVNAGEYQQSVTFLSGADASNYGLPAFTTADPTYTVDRKMLTVAAIAAGRSSYGEALQPGAVSLSGVESGDAVSGISKISNPSLSGSGYVSAGDYRQSVDSLTGSDALNYFVKPFVSPALAYRVAPRELNVLSIADVQTAYASPRQPGRVAFKDLIAGDDVSSVAIVEAAAVSGSGNLPVGGYYQVAGHISGREAANYTLVPYKTPDKNYVVTVGPAVNLGKVGLVGVVPGDDVQLNARAAAAGEYILSGKDAANYRFDSSELSFDPETKKKQGIVISCDACDFSRNAFRPTLTEWQGQLLVLADTSLTFFGAMASESTSPGAWANNSPPVTTNLSDDQAQKSYDDAEQHAITLVSDSLSLSADGASATSPQRLQFLLQEAAARIRRMVLPAGGAVR